MHPLAFTAGSNDAGLAQRSEVALYFGLALAENLDQIADADLAAYHQVEQAQASEVGQRREETVQADRFGAAAHEIIIYVLTDMSSEDIFVLANMRR